MKSVARLEEEIITIAAALLEHDEKGQLSPQIKKRLGLIVKQ